MRSKGYPRSKGNPRSCQALIRGVLAKVWRPQLDLVRVIEIEGEGNPRSGQALIRGVLFPRFGIFSWTMSG